MLQWLNKLSLVQLFFVIIYMPVILVLLVVISINFNHSKNQFEEYSETLNGFITDEIEKIIEFQDLAFKNLNLTLNNHLKAKSQLIVDEYTNGTFDPETDNILNLQKRVGLKNGTEDIYFINTKGVVINTTFSNDLNLNLFTFGSEHKNFLFDVFNSRTYHHDAITVESSTKRLKKYTYQATPDGKYIVELGSYCLEAENILNFVEKRMDNIEEKYNSVYAVGLFLKADKAFSLSKKRKPENFNKNLLERTFKDKKDLHLTLDTLETELMFHFDYIKKGGSSLYGEAVVCVISDLKHQKEFVNAEILRYSIIFLIVGVLLIGVLRFFFRQNITRPLKKSIKLLDKLSNGEVPELRNNLYNNKKNEIGKLIYSLRKLILNLKRSVEFAQQIEQGNLDAEIAISTNKDDLGLSLKKMKNGLLKKQKEDEEKQAVEEDRKWHMFGLAKFNNIISQHRGDISSLCNSIISELVEYAEIQIGGIYLSKVSNNKENILELTASYAYDRQKYLNKEIFYGEGLIGTCAIEQESFLLQEIPDDYLSITSGVGEAKPRSLAIIPIVMDGKTLGVIEIASFEDIGDKKLNFVKKLAEDFGGAILKTQLNTEAEILREKFEQQQMEIEQLKYEKQVLNEWIQNANLAKKPIA